MRLFHLKKEVYLHVSDNRKEFIDVSTLDILFHATISREYDLMQLISRGLIEICPIGFSPCSILRKRKKKFNRILVNLNWNCV